MQGKERCWNEGFRNLRVHSGGSFLISISICFCRNWNWSIFAGSLGGRMRSKSQSLGEPCRVSVTTHSRRGKDETKAVFTKSLLACIAHERMLGFDH